MSNPFYKGGNVVLPVLFVLDASNSSNEWMEDVFKNTIKHLNEDPSLKDYDFQIGILVSGNNWITGDRLIPIVECIHMYLPESKRCSIKDIASTLNQFLTEDKLFCFDTDVNILQPSIVILTDGQARGMDIYQKLEINLLWDNEIYRSANRFVISNQGVTALFQCPPIDYVKCLQLDITDVH